MTPPYRLDDGALFVAYANAAEYSFHLACGWDLPANAIDCHIEFRHLNNDGHVKSGDRPKGFYALPGAVSFFGGDAIDMAAKDGWRDRIIQGPPFTAQERQGIFDYCAGDVASWRVYSRAFSPPFGFRTRCSVRNSWPQQRARSGGGYQSTFHI